MTNRFLPAVLVCLAASAAVASAGPLPWSYYVRVNAPDGYDGILFGSEVKPPDTDGGEGVKFSHYWDTQAGNYGVVRINIETTNETASLFSFGPGFAQTVETLPADKRLSPGIFQLSWGFSDRDGRTAGGSTTGTLTADGLSTTGTGNYFIALDHTEAVNLDGRFAHIRFEGVNTESGARIEMSVSEIAYNAPQVPEPGTLILGGIAAVGGLGAWLKKRR